MRLPIKHLVRDKIESVVPGLHVVSVWIGRCVEPATNLECARQSSGSGFLVQPEGQFVNGEIAVGRTQIPSKSIAIDVLRERIALKDSPLVTQPVYWRKRYPDSQCTHRIRWTSIRDVIGEIRRPTKCSIEKHNGMRGEIKLGIRSQLSHPNRNSVA